MKQIIPNMKREDGGGRKDKVKRKKGKGIRNVEF